MASKRRRWRRVTGLALLVLGLGSAVRYGVAQSAVVKQAEWAVYMVQALDLEWNLPLKAKSDDYIARLNWKSGIEFAARQTVTSLGLEEHPGAEEEDPGFVRAMATPSEAVYSMATLRPGEYGLRVRLAGGGAVLKVGSTVFDVFQPNEEFAWIDLDRVSLDPGSHEMSLLLSEGTRAQKLAITPPCVLPVEPPKGWDALEDLHYGEMAVTIAKALDLENQLPPLGSEISIKGEEFARVFQYPPLVEQTPDEAPDPFWLTSQNSIIVARAHFTVPEDGLYAIETRYLSPTPVRWVIDRCLRVVTCPVSGGRGARWTRTTALDLVAGVHEIEVTLPPNAALDRIVVRQRDGSPDEYLGIVESEGFKMESAETPVRRREAVAAARRLQSLFGRHAAARCADTLVAMEKAAALRFASASSLDSTEGGLQQGLPPLTGTTAGDFDSGGGGDPLFPKGDTEPDVSSPITP